MVQETVTLNTHYLDILGNKRQVKHSVIPGVTTREKIAEELHRLFNNKEN